MSLVHLVQHNVDAQNVSRDHAAFTCQVGADVAGADEINLRNSAGGRIHIPNDSSITSITFHDAPNPGGVFNASYDDTPTTPVAITLTGLSANRSYPIPAKLFAAGAVKMTGNAAGTVAVSLKS